MIDWEEVGTILVRGLVVLAVLAYYGGRLLRGWVDVTSRVLAKHWPSRPVVDHLRAAKVFVDHVERIHERQPIVRARWMLARGMSKAAISRELQIPRTTLRRMLAA